MGAQHVTLDELAAESDLLFVWVEDPSFVSLHLCFTVEKCSLLYVPVCRCGCVSAFVAFCVVLPPSWCCLVVSCCMFNVHHILKRLDRRCASLNPTTEGIVSRSLLSKMRPTTCIINTSRGGLVDQEALVEALEVSIIHPWWREHALPCRKEELEEQVLMWWLRSPWARIIDLRVVRTLCSLHTLAGLWNCLDDWMPSNPLPLSKRMTTLTCSATTAARTGMANSAVENLLAGLKGLELPEPIIGWRMPQNKHFFGQVTVYWFIIY